MRIAAGILMIATAVIGFTFIRTMVALDSDIPNPNLLKWLSTFWAAFVGYGGVLTLRREAWKLCLISSILQVWVPPYIGILPLVFICVRKREWREFQG
jgi:hypothetical protein